MELLFDEDEREVYWERYNKNRELAEKTHFLTTGSLEKLTAKRYSRNQNSQNNQIMKDNQGVF